MNTASSFPFSARVAAAQSLLEAALADADDGLSPDLEPLQEAIIDICARAADLPAAERDEARAATEGLLQTLDRLIGLLTTQRDALQQELGTVTTSKNAAKAYMKAKKE